MKIISNLDMVQNQILNLRLQVLATAPGSPVTGQMYYDSALLAAFVWNGTAWISTDASRVANAYIPLTKLATDPLARANHTGTQLASTISDFTTAVQAIKWNTLTTPTTAIAAGGQVINNLGNAVADTDAVNLGQAKGLLYGSLAAKPSRVMATTNITVSNPGTATFDGITLSNGERLFLGMNQTAGAERGIYVFNGSGVALTRALDMDTAGEIVPGTRVYVAEGTVNLDKTFELITDGTVTIGTTAQVYRDATSATYAAGNGITLTGSTFSVNPASGGGISVAVGGVSVDSATVPRKFASDVGNGSLTTVGITHNLGTRDVRVEVYRNTTPWDTIICDVERPDGNNINLIFSVAPTTNQYRVTVQG